MGTRRAPSILRTIDAHTAGEPLRLMLDGWPAPKGRTMLERRAWAKSRQDRLRRALMFEPRGHADMYGALLTEPEHPDSDTGVLFMHNEGFSTMCGHGIIAVTTILIERGSRVRGCEGAGVREGGRGLGAGGWPDSLGPFFERLGKPAGTAEADDHRSSMNPGNPGTLGPSAPRTVALSLDAPAGRIRACAEVVPRGDGVRVRRVSFINVPSFVLAAGLTVPFGGKSIPVDVAFGGAFYAIVDAEAAGLVVRRDRLTELGEAGTAIKRAVEKAVTVVHPHEPGLTGVYGTIFTAPPTVTGADLRNVTIFADREVDRSPCGTGTCAVLAVLDAMGLVDPAKPFVHESVIGTTFSARVAERTTVGDRPAIVPELSGEAWITGEHTFVVDPDDPLARGFRI